MDVLAAAARGVRPGGDLAGPGARRSAGRLLRPRALRLRRDRQAVGRANPNFKQIANGLPGIEARLPLLFDAMVSKGRLGLRKFVELTATAPAKIYNLHPRKGSIAIGADADLVIWDPKRRLRWPTACCTTARATRPTRVARSPAGPRRCCAVARSSSRGKLAAKPGSGAFLPRAGGAAAAPLEPPDGGWVPRSATWSLAAMALRMP